VLHTVGGGSRTECPAHVTSGGGVLPAQNALPTLQAGALSATDSHGNNETQVGGALTAGAQQQKRCADGSRMIRKNSAETAQREGGGRHHAAAIQQYSDCGQGDLGAQITAVTARHNM
jgi:hypothetical protein